MKETEMSTRTLTVICLSAALLASANAAHAGVIKNVAKVAKFNVEAQKKILIEGKKLPLVPGGPLKQEAFVAKVTALCLAKAATKKPC
jgi:hypothetical protein